MTEPADFADIADVLAELENAHDRAAAIILCALVEDALTAAIVSRLIDLNEKEYERVFGAQGPLFTLAAKIRMGFALGIYGPNVRDDLQVICDLRNAFAHSRKSIKFETPQVASKCKNLKTLGHISSSDAPELPWPPQSPRKQYLATTQILWHDLNRAATYRVCPSKPCALLRY